MSRQKSLNLLPSKAIIQIMYVYIVCNIKPYMINKVNILNNFISIWLNEFVMVYLKYFSQSNMIYCFIVDFRLFFVCDISKQTVTSIICSFFMFYSMVGKCMTQWQKLSVFWQQAGHVEMYIVLINTTNKVRQLYIFQCWWLNI